MPTIEPTRRPAADAAASADSPTEAGARAGLAPDALLAQARTHFRQAYDAVHEDWLAAEAVQDFIAGQQWPSAVQQERERFGRPCLVLDHLNQYCRHVINSALLRRLDIRILPMDGPADPEVATIIAGIVRQITHTSTSRIAYETGLRHAVQVGFGYWKVRAQPIPRSGGQLELAIVRIRDPRTVLVDPFCEYPDARDADYGFCLYKLSEAEYRAQYGGEADRAPVSWQAPGAGVFPWTERGGVIVAEYYYRHTDGRYYWALLTQDRVLDGGPQYGDVFPIVRVVGEEYEVQGKPRMRGLIAPAMDSQRAYNYSASAFIEAVALAPIAPFIAAEGQVEQFEQEWKEAHRIPRAVLRYRPIEKHGQIVPPPQRSQPAGIPAGWQGMMDNMIRDQQFITGLAQPSIQGTGGAPVQSGAGITAQQEPGVINAAHFHEHWMAAIEQTGRILIAMIPDVYTTEQIIKIMGEDGTLQTAWLDPTAAAAVINKVDALGKVLGKAYNPQIGRYDVAVTLGPSSATKRQEANKMLMTAVNAYPDLMKIAGDVIFQTMDVAGAEIVAQRLKLLLPPEVAGTVTPGQLAAQVQELTQQLAATQAQLDEAKQLLLAEAQKAEAAQAKAAMDNATALREAQIKTQRDLEIAVLDNITRLLVERMKAGATIQRELLSQLSGIGQAAEHAARMRGYLDVLEALGAEGPVAAPPPPSVAESVPPPPPPPPPPPVPPIHIHLPAPAKKSFILTRPDGSISRVDELPEELTETKED